MVWLSIVSLSVGALLAQRFRITVLVPATLAVVVVAIGAGVAQANHAWLIVGVTAAASVSIQVGYFVGMLIQDGLNALMASRSSPLSHTTSARNTGP
jgi:membrane protein DedA with SNARE-associated domain